MSEQKLSIITPTYNAEKYIRKCILSVASQSYTNKEHLIIDGSSTDQTLDIIEKHAAQHPHIRFITEKDNGIYDAMNKGIGLSDSDWLYFLGSDDVLLDNRVFTDILKSSEAEISDVVYGNVQWGQEGFAYDGEFSCLKLMEKNICHQSIFFRKTVFDRLGLFNVRYKVLADWEFNMRWFGNPHIRKKYLDRIIALYQPGGYSTNNKDQLFLHDKENLIRKSFPEEFVTMFYAHVSTALSEQQKHIEWLNMALQQRDEELRSIYRTPAGLFIKLYKHYRKKRSGNAQRN
ncbi:MAG: glycosyltransferase [Chlorobium sp.]|uniref:glycosyltransferase family 2 protein n=1 Tax=Chlorobium sp. TaxID=1095 RepID=UPI0025C11581|nr:glycosyltransferase family 2 protein [Chlorobium sp.]MCF8383972.1 glycosyltransferase [Chlorobium sp.]